MQNIRVLTRIVAVLLATMTLSGCNLFDPLDTGISGRSNSELIKEGNIALDSGDFAHSFEIFQNLFGNMAGEPEVARGLGESYAGKSGFKVTSIMSALQSTTANADRAPILFKTAYLIASRTYLEKGISVLMQNAEPLRPDYLARGLMRIPSAVRVFLEKYDTNRNGRLDENDVIGFETNDVALPTWPVLYKNLVSGPSDINCTLEQTYADLAYGFDGNGASWTLFTPVQGKPISGTYTTPNKSTILAVGDFVDRINLANTYFNVHTASFAAAIQNLDGVE